MPTIKEIIKCRRECLMPLIREGHEAVINHEEVEEYEEKVNQFYHQTILAVLEGLKEDIESKQICDFSYNKALSDITQQLDNLIKEL